MLLHHKLSEAERNWIISFMILPIMISSFFMQYYVHFIKSYVLYMLIMLVSAAVIGSVAMNRLRSSWKTLCSLWYVAIVCVMINIIRTEFDLNVYVDLVTFVCCAVMMACTGRNRLIYKKAVWIIVAFSVYFAASVWFQMLFPEQYRRCFANYLPERPMYVVLGLANEGAGYTGFSTNPGYTAGHLAAGILMVFAYTLTRPIKSKGFLGGCALLAFLLISMFMTGKRAPGVFILATLAAVLFVTLDKKQKMRTIKIAFKAGCIGILLLLIFRKPLSGIPFLARLFDTLEGLLSGEDVSNNRAILYEFGMKLFRMNPLFGVGWCNFRRMGAGVITQFTELEAHNIYLQLLCETGIVGAAVILTPIVVFLYQTYRAVVETARSTQAGAAGWKMLLLFSFGYQLYFVVNGTMDNLLYDHNYVIMYFAALSMFMSYRRYQHKASFGQRNSYSPKRKKRL